MIVFYLGRYMGYSNVFLLRFLQNNDGDFSGIEKFNPTELSNLYIKSALLISIMPFIKEQLWLSDKQDKIDNIETSYENFLRPFFIKELNPIEFFKEFLIEQGSSGIKNILKSCVLFEKEIISQAMHYESSDQKVFLIVSLNTMTELFLHEENSDEKLELYRTFDRLDDIFELNYQLDRDMSVDRDTTERLYERAGIGVQSGYSTILLALEKTNPQQGSKVIDLGSGYGRVGLVYSLLRPDLDFIGYEYVEHRVENSKIACDFLELNDSLTFLTQDLSLESFDIPIADIYYLYDPFTKETYDFVLKQIVEISRSKVIKIVTKGNARLWFTEIAKTHNWPKPTLLDNGNLCIFNSQ